MTRQSRFSPRPSRADVAIDWNDKKQRFEIVCPFHANGLIQKLPRRRWSKALRIWAVPPDRRNIEAIRNILLPLSPTVSTEAMRELSKEVAPRPTTDRPWPTAFRFRKEPRPLQQQALEKVHPLDTYALFMGMRTGKTKTTIDNRAAHFMAGRVNAAVVICLNSIKREWRDQIIEHISPDVEPEVHVLTAGKYKQFEEWLLSPAEDRMRWLIAGVESLSSGQQHKYIERFMLANRCSLDIDESTSIKNYRATRTERVFELGKLATHRSILTGTPVTNGPMDKYAQFEFLDPDILGFGDFYSFRNHYAIMGGYEDREIVGYQNLDELVSTVAPYVFQARTPKTVPEAHYRRVVKMSPQQKAATKEIQKTRLLERGEAQMRAETVLELMLRMQQIACGFLSFERDDPLNPKKRIKQYEFLQEAKTTELLHIAEETDEQVIVWGIYRPQIERIAERLRSVYGDDQVVEVHGGIDEEQRHYDIKHRFQTGDARFIVGYPKLGARGIDLSAGTIMVFMGNLFEWEARVQSMYRFLGEAQKKPVAYFDIIAENSVDEIVLEALEAKQDVAYYVRDRLDEVLGRLKKVD